MPLSKIIIAIFLISLVIFLERLFPFAVFSNRAPGKLIHFFEKYIPPFVMLGLLIYSLRDTRFSTLVQWVPQISAIVFTMISYVWKKNTLISIFGGTIIYMVLIRVL
ncbi:MAG: AzlD domain-containing protein [Treponema sp.]|nr:AzlD domain-containing protein [Treponema sp.]